MRVVVLNPANPQMNAITAALARAGALHVCIFPFRTGGALGRFGPRTPWLGRRLAADLDRRRVLADVPDRLLVQPAVGWEVARALADRARRSGAPIPAELHRRIIERRNRRMGRAARAYLREADVVLASETMALDAFEEARRLGVLCVLEAATAHHRFSARTLSEEARLHPEFAATLEPIRPPQRQAQRRDREIEMADVVLAPSRFVAESYLEHGTSAERIVRASYGVDSSRFTPGDDSDRAAPFGVLFVGGIGQRKGVSYLLDAYRAFRKADTELILVGAPIGGPRPLAPYRGLFRHVPFLPHWEMPAVFRSASVLVVSSPIEGLPLVALEAMAAGLPVVATPCGADEAVRDGVDGFVVPFRDPAAISDRLERLYRSAELRRRMGEAARRRALEFTWERYGDEVVRILDGRLAAWKARGGSGTR